ncbi:MAG: HAMP domain-containing protein [Acidimicrobiia bacterium]|nr:HAMP domain-containing protein [Acidimicrobiia bacterium]
MPGKLVFAAVPLILALSGVSALYVQSAFVRADEERHAARLAVVMEELSSTLEALAAETVGGDPVGTDAALAELGDTIASLDAGPLARQLDAAVRRLEGARGSGEIAAYDQVAADLLAMGSLVPAEVANEGSARSLEGLHAIARARQVARAQERVIVTAFPLTEAERTTLERIRALQVDFTGWVDLFHTVASAEARTIFAQSGAPVAIGGVSTHVNRLLEGSEVLISVSDWEALLAERSSALGVFEERLAQEVRTTAEAAADRATAESWAVVAAAVAALVIAAFMTALISRSIVRRVRSVTERAQHVAQEQLPALVEALRDPGEDSPLPSIPPIRDRGADEIGDLARSFSAMQSTLEHVAAQQVETLRKGVAEMFVTLARRNRSLIDRQLALIDELESDEEDPASLADLYRLDHMATRMRRNAESLLVMAGSEPPRSWREPLGIDDVVRAAMGEIEDYRRVDVLTLEPVRLKGVVVADLSHLLSELLENAAQFSPPQTRVRVSGHFHEQGYLLTVADRGVGITQTRLAELNQLLERPPVIGLALEPTLGLYVVAMLAKRHGIGVRLVPGAPGLSAKLLIPAHLYDIPADPVAPDAPVVEKLAERPVFESVSRRRIPIEAAPKTPPAQVPTARWAPPTRVEEETTAPDAELVQPARNAESPSVSTPDAGSVQPAPITSAPVTPNPEPSQRPTAPASTGNGLPVRRPGASFAPDPTSERPVSSSRSADAVRSSLGAFQTGLEAGRRATEDHEGVRE